jgi:hypothetical protein
LINGPPSRRSAVSIAASSTVIRSDAVEVGVIGRANVSFAA